MSNSKLADYIVNNEPAFQNRNRLSSLYSDFALQATTNPDGYVANLSAWQAALTKACLAGLAPGQDRLVLHAGEILYEALEVKGLGRPLGLKAVMVRESEKHKKSTVKSS